MGAGWPRRCGLGGSPSGRGASGGLVATSRWQRADILFRRELPPKPQKLSFAHSVPFLSDGQPLSSKSSPEAVLAMQAFHRPAV